MSSSAQATQNCITLRGSAQIISKYLKYGINSILFQRGIYPPETFENVQQYGLTILMSTDPKIEEFIKNVLSQTEEWLSKNLIKKVSLVIMNVHTREVLECWDFQMQAESTATDETLAETERISTKDMKRIQAEIRDVMRQISATVSFLPLIESVCTFDVNIHTPAETAVPESWNETGAVFIQNSHDVVMRSFSTGLHKVETIVHYKAA